MAATYIQSQPYIDGASDTHNITFPGDTGAGAGIGVQFLAFDVEEAGPPVVVSITDNKGGSYELVPGSGQDQFFDIARCASYAASGVSGGAGHTVTITFDRDVFLVAAIVEASGVNGVAGGNAVETDSTGGIAGAAVAPTSNGLHVGFIWTLDPTTSFTPDSGWTERLEANDGDPNGWSLTLMTRAAVEDVSQSPGADFSAAEIAFCGITHFVFADAPPLTLTQAGFRFYDDDGGEE
jgi:hypothetical protein